MHPSRRMKKKAIERELKGWKEIADFLGQPVATAERWAKSGMPVRRSGRCVVSSPDELNRWLGRESGVDLPVHIARTGTEDLMAELRRGLSAANIRFTGSSNHSSHHWPFAAVAIPRKCSAPAKARGMYVGKADAENGVIMLKPQFRSSGILLVNQSLRPHRWPLVRARKPQHRAQSRRTQQSPTLPPCRERSVV